MQHDATVTQLEGTITELQKAEKRLDRFKSASVRAVETRGPAEQDKTEDDRKAASAQPSRPESPAAVAKHEPGEVVVNGIPSEQVAEISAKLESRTQEVEELRNDRTALKKDLDNLRGKVHRFTVAPARCRLADPLR